MTRWETISGTSHVVEHTQADRDEYPLARPGDRVVRLEAEASGLRLGATFVVPGDTYGPAATFAHRMRQAVRRLEKMGAT